MYLCRDGWAFLSICNISDQVTPHALSIHMMIFCLVKEPKSNFCSQEGCRAGQVTAIAVAHAGIRVMIVTILPTLDVLPLAPHKVLPEQLGPFGDFIILSDGHRPRSFDISHPV